MTALDDLRDLRDALDCIAHGALPRWFQATTVVGGEAQRAAKTVYTKYIASMRAASMAQPSIDRAKAADDAHREHAAALTDRCEAAELKLAALVEAAEPCCRAVRTARGAL